MSRLVVAILVALVLGVLALVPATASAAADDARYALVHGCYALRSESAGRFVAERPDRTYAATAESPAAAEPLRMQATALGRYLLYGRDRDYLAAGDDGNVAVATAASDLADWRVDVAEGGAFRITLPTLEKALVASGGGRLALADPAGAGRAGLFTFVPAGGCPEFPEVDVSATGTPARSPTPFGEVSGLLDAHMHMMAFEFLGGRAHCGRPWHPYGVEHALVDCPDHYPAQGGAAVLENVLSYGTPARTHDPVGWPTFKDWPHHASLTHEQSYYKWVERAWMGGLRLYVNLLVDNAVLCEVYPYKRNPCDEMQTVRLEARRTRELQDYIDAQSGGPGKGWFRIVDDPFEARRVISEGKLAVVLGIEVSKLFDCGVYNDQPECTTEQIDKALDEVHALGVRDMELVNKFDNALGGVAGDSGTTGIVVNNGNKLETGKYWQLQHCDGHAHDRTQPTATGHNTDSLVANTLDAFAPMGTLPVYPEPPHCNVRGLSSLGEHLVRRMIEKKMVIDPDHLSVLARQQLLNVVESENYSGIVSSHSWSTPDAIPRIYRLGGVVTPYAGSSTSFVQQWKDTKVMRDPRFFYGIGYGADMNGFGSQGEPRQGPNPVTYPFRSVDGSVTLERQRSGERVFDINTDGVAHYGLYPDWVEDLRKIAGEEIVGDMARGAEAYLQMWERAEGVPRTRCRAARARVTRTGIGPVAVGAAHGRLLRRAGQPSSRRARAWHWCANGRGNGQVRAVLSRDGAVVLVASTARGHRARGIGPGARVSRALRRATRGFGTGIRVRSAGRRARLVYGVRKGRVAWVATASRRATPTRAALRRQLRFAGLR